MKLIGKINSPSALALAQALPDWPGIIRWGGGQSPNAIQGQVHLLDGLEQLTAFKAAKIPCPEFTTNYDLAITWSKAGVILGRNTNHSQGFDIIPFGGRLVFANQRIANRFRAKDFWVKAIRNIQSEWRVHIMRSKKTGTYYSIGMGLKEHVAQIKAKPAQAGFEIRSRRLGWHLRHDVELPETVRQLAKDAVAAVKYDFGAVDILVGETGPVVLEVNSCPAIRDDYTIDRYAKSLVKYYPQGVV